ncbi:MAG: STAS domain-containing protein [Proteobacteria bacterium]|nr:STAS domain-containing protein [Pseudomonadota bacterium]
MTTFPTKHRDNITIIRLPYRVDVSNTRELVATIRGAIAEERSLLVLDLQETRAIDSTALGAIIHLFKTLRVGEGDLVFAGVGPGVRRIFAVTHLDRVFAIHPSVSAAIEARDACSMSA